MGALMAWSVLGVACTAGDDPELAGAFVDRSEAMPSIRVETADLTTTMGGLAAVDVDGDGDPDLVVVSDVGGAYLLRNDGGVFTDATDESGLDVVFAPSSVAFADVDADGDPDLYIGAAGASYLLLNDGTGRFDDATATWLPGDDTVASVRGGASFADYDRDGRLDLYQTQFYQGIPGVSDNPPNQLWHHDGAAFAPVATSPAGADDPSTSLVAAWHDVDDDGWLDLLVINDWGPYLTPNQAYRNMGPGAEPPFEDSGAAWGLDHAVFGMSAALGDVDGDGDFDVYVTNVADNLLLIKEDGGFTEAAEAWGVTAGGFDDPVPMPESVPEWPVLDPEDADRRLAGMAVFCETFCAPDLHPWVMSSWGAELFDADHDGDLDLFVANGTVSNGIIPEGDGQPNRLFLQADGAFTAAPEALFPTFRGSSRGTVTLDADGDGDLDLVWVDNGHDGVAGVRYAENQLATGRSLVLVLDEPGTDAIGARVRVTAGGVTHVREVDGGRGFMSASQRLVHVGLGDTEVLDAVEITWPDGTVESVDVDALELDLLQHWSRGG